MAKEEFTGIKPERVWKYFLDISKIPRCSGHEEKIINYLEDFAKTQHLRYKKDNAGNLCIKKAPFPGFENRPGVVLQGHVDMVCEKNSGTKFNFETDSLKLIRDGDWLTAEGTTLGADNGIAVAMSLAVLSDNSLKHGPLEVLFTVDEETGLTGATNLDPSIVDGRILINIDSEEEGIFYIGCAGGITTIGIIPVNFEKAPQDSVFFTLKLSGLHGGHSGAEIHEGWGNSVVLGTRVLKAVNDKTSVRIMSLDGGDKHNAIPREFIASFCVDNNKTDEVKQITEHFKAVFKEEYSDLEPNLSVELIPLGSQGDRGNVLTAKDSDNIIKTLFILPHGVMGMSRKLPGLVETSTNLAAVHLVKDSVTILTSQRSSVMSAMDYIAARVRVILENTGAKITIEGQHPAWDPDPDSNILKTFRRIYKNVTSREAEVTAIHAGLECGVLGEKFKDMEMISFGPDMKDVHSPEERLSISSVARTWDFFLEVLKGI